ncbi:MAG: SufE family protein [Spirochaetota bacterium]
MSMQQKQQKVVEEISKCGEWFEVYEHIIRLGKELPPLAPRYRTDENSISGCQSSVWIVHEVHDGALYYSADSDALITRGIIALVLSVINGSSPEEIVHADFGFLDTVGLSTHLSPSRANGLTSILSRIRETAAQHTAPHR